MAESGGPRGFLASVVGWVLVGVVVFLLFGFVVGTIRLLLRIALIVVVVGGLAWAYVKLKGDS